MSAGPGVLSLLRPILVQSSPVDVATAQSLGCSMTAPLVSFFRSLSRASPARITKPSHKPRVRPVRSGGQGDCESQHSGTEALLFLIMCASVLPIRAWSPRCLLLLPSSPVAGRPTVDCALFRCFAVWSPPKVCRVPRAQCDPVPVWVSSQ